MTQHFSLNALVFDCHSTGYRALRLLQDLIAELYDQVFGHVLHERIAFSRPFVGNDCNALVEFYRYSVWTIISRERYELAKRK